MTTSDTRLKADFDSYKETAPLCSKHFPNGGKRNKCLVCACMELSQALSRIDYLMGAPNEYQVSTYDVFPVPRDVVHRAERYIGNGKKYLQALTFLLNHFEGLHFVSTVMDNDGKTTGPYVILYQHYTPLGRGSTSLEALLDAIGKYAEHG